MVSGAAAGFCSAGLLCRLEVRCCGASASCSMSSAVSWRCLDPGIPISLVGEGGRGERGRELERDATADSHTPKAREAAHRTCRRGRAREHARATASERARACAPRDLHVRAHDRCRFARAAGPLLGDGIALRLGERALPPLRHRLQPLPPLLHQLHRRARQRLRQIPAGRGTGVAGVRGECKAGAAAAGEWRAQSRSGMRAHAAQGRWPAAWRAHFASGAVGPQRRLLPAGEAGR